MIIRKIYNLPISTKSS